jgi:hypothetical protein
VETEARPRSRRTALLLAGAALACAAGGALWFAHFVSQLRRDPGIVYRDPGTLDKLLRRGTDAERAGDRGAAITAYRFVVAVGRGRGSGGAGTDAAVAPYVAAAAAGLRRLGVSDTLPSPPR